MADATPTPKPEPNEVALRAASDEVRRLAAEFNAAVRHAEDLGLEVMISETSIDRIRIESITHAKNY